MLETVLEFLDPRPGQVIVDVTVGRGGHSAAIVERLGFKGGVPAGGTGEGRTPAGTLLAMDVDPRNLEYARQRIEPIAQPLGVTCRWFHANFAELDDVLVSAGIEKVDGLLADLGVSTNQIIERHHGLSFSTEGPLDMRLDPRIRKTAADLLAEMTERQIADTLFHLAQERFSFKIARKIVQTRATEPIRTTGQLARLVRAVVPARPGQIDPATRTFQALRMLVNEEIPSLEAFLDLVPDAVKPGGRGVFISFHSGEDRLVKQAIRSWHAEGWCDILTKKPLEPSEAEMAANPRSRSAKLRAARFTAEGDADHSQADMESRGPGESES